MAQDVADNFSAIGNGLRLSADFQHFVFIIRKFDQIRAATHCGNAERRIRIHHKNYQKQVSKTHTPSLLTAGSVFPGKSQLAMYMTANNSDRVEGAGPALKIKRRQLFEKPQNIKKALFRKANFYERGPAGF
jgi:hypothetical protein